MQAFNFEADLLHGVDWQIFNLQRRLFADQNLRDRFHADWKAKRDSGSTMIEAIRRTRDEWLNKQLQEV